MLLHHIPLAAFPIVHMGANQPFVVELQLAPAGNVDAGLPGQRRCPVQRPVRANLVAILLDVVQIHLGIAEPGFDEAQHGVVAIAPPKLVHRVFEVHIVAVDAVGLIRRKVAIVRLEYLNNIHKTINRYINSFITFALRLLCTPFVPTRK